MEEKKFEIEKLMTFIIIVIVVLGLFYGLTLLLTNKKSGEITNNNEIDTVIQYDEIIVGNIFKQSEEEYYVLAITTDDASAGSYTSLLEEFMASENALKIYTIDLGNGFNKSYVSEISSFEGTPIFKESTLLKISGKETTDIYEGKEKVLNQLQIIIDEIKE